MVFNSVMGGYEVGDNQSLDFNFVCIPEYYNDLPVTSITNSAFMNNSIIKTITIGKNIATIEVGQGSSWDGIGAFAHSAIENVIFAEGIQLEIIPTHAFLNSNLNSVLIPDSVTTIGTAAFSRNQLITVAIPNNVTSIGLEAFRLNHLEEVEIPEGITAIGSQAFMQNQLTTVVIPKSVTEIGYGAFSFNRLSAVKIPEKVTSIGSRAFSSNQLTTVEIPESVVSIGSYAFQGNQLTSVLIPENVAIIEEGALSGNLSTIKIYIPFITLEEADLAWGIRWRQLEAWVTNDDGERVLDWIYMTAAIIGTEGQEWHINL
jgi:hypothetical protein